LALSYLPAHSCIGALNDQAGYKFIFLNEID
jgi:hypothetical protein